VSDPFHCLRYLSVAESVMRWRCAPSWSAAFEAEWRIWATSLVLTLPSSVPRALQDCHGTGI